MEKFLITGALGQIGSELSLAIANKWGKNNVIASDIKNITGSEITYKQLDVLNVSDIEKIVKDYKITYIIHLASILSAKGETNPQLLWNINMNGLYNILEVARKYKLRVFTPSSIAAFGIDTPANNTPQITVQRPSTIYGISKVAGELLCDYYFEKFNVDTRSLRFPGLISYKTPPGGGTTDYAIQVYYDALQNKVSNIPLKQNTKMDFMYMSDAIDATLKLILAPANKLVNRNAYNISAFSASPIDFYESIKKQVPSFQVEYNPNETLQTIANSWPNSINSSCAVSEWGFSPKYNLDDVTSIMLNKIKT